MSITNLESKCWFCQEEDIKVSNSEKIQLINEKTKEIYKTFIYRCKRHQHHCLYPHTHGYIMHGSSLFH